MKAMRKLLFTLTALLFACGAACAQTYQGNTEFNNAGITTLPNNQGSQSSAVTCNWGLSTTCFFVATGNVTVTFTAPANPAVLYLIVKQDTTGGRTITTPALILGNASAQTTDEFCQQASCISEMVLFFDGSNYETMSTPMLANSCSGQVTTVSSSATVANKCCTASTNVFGCADTSGTGANTCDISCSAGTITIKAGAAADTVNWWRIH
jgi:hypothetical protein